MLNFMVSLGGSADNGGDAPGIDPGTFGAALSNLSFQNAQYRVYCLGGPSDCLPQMVADISRSVDRHEAVAALLYGSKYGIIRTHGWDQHCGIFKCGPKLDYFYAAIPAAGYGQSFYLAPTDLVNALVANTQGIGHAYFHGPTFAAMSPENWQEWTDNAGTYYGDPDPPDPDCAPDFLPDCGDGGGGDDDPPLEELAALGDPSKRAKPIHAHPTTRQQVIEDFVQGIRAWRLDLEPQLSSLTLADGKLRVTSVVPVKCLGDCDDYHVLTISSDETNLPFAEATINSRGFLGALHLSEGQTRPDFSAEQAEKILFNRFGVLRGTHAERVLAFGELGQGPFDPAFLMKDTLGINFLVTSSGQAYELVAERVGLSRMLGEKLLRGKNGSTIAVRALVPTR